MGQQLSIALQRHYVRRGNRVIFSTLTGEMSLNALALAIWERVGGHSVDPSVVSRVLAGKRDFTKAQLDAFAEILDLPDRAIIILHDALSADILARHDIISTASTDAYLTLLDAQVKRIRDLRIRGNPHLAVSWVDETWSSIRTSVDGPMAPAATNELLRSGAALLAEKAIAFSRVETSNNLAAKMKTVIGDMELISQHVGDEHLKALVTFTWANVLYNLDDHRAAIRLMEQVCPTVQDDSVAHLNVLRTLAISFSRLGDDSGTRNIGTRIHTLIDTGQCDRVDILAETLEGLARAEGLSGMPQAMNTLAAAQDYVAQAEPKSMLQAELQIHRTAAEILLHIAPSERHLIERHIANGTAIAASDNYTKYLNQFAAMTTRLEGYGQLSQSTQHGRHSNSRT